jgi:NADH-quinone oxidoreductase subunit C
LADDATPSEPTADDGTGAEEAADAAAEETADAAEPESEPEPELDPVVASLLERISAELGDAILDSADSFGTLVIRVRPDAWRRAGEIAKRSLECDYLSYIAGIDWQPAEKLVSEDSGDTSTPAQPSEMTPGVAGSAGRFQVLAHVQSTAKHWGVTMKADVDDDSPHLASWVPVYAGADWHERECWEMFGIVFDGHPSLRHLYLPAEFEGHPLRKDFPLLAREVKPWPGIVDVEPMPGEDAPAEGATAEVEA